MLFLQQRRKKFFGDGRPRQLDRNAKARITMRAWALTRPTEKGRVCGAISAKAYAVLHALLWEFHNAKSGLCFPSYEVIAEKAGCARSTVAEAIKQLEAAGLLSWVHRIKRIKERCKDLFGEDGVRVRVVRTSNAYAFCDPQPQKQPEIQANSSKSDSRSGTLNQVLFSYPINEIDPNSPLGKALEKLSEGVRSSQRSRVEENNPLPALF